jgi:uncharacterized protein YdhG (YjbR/CyaY superfamily)
MKSSKQRIAKSVDDYLAKVPAEPRAALQRLRRIIKATAPKAIETISYRIPVYKYQGMLVAFAAFKNHCSFFPGAAIVKDYKRDLQGYGTSKGTIRFPVDRPLPKTLVKKMIKARIEQNEERTIARRR